MIRVALVLVMLAGVAHAEPSNRVVLADADPELQRAIATTLAPWKLEVVVDSAAPIDAMQARDRADEKTARFVVWRDGTDLVVFDRETGEAEHRETPAGALDPVSAAAAALTVKTLMRLPAPPDETPAPAPIIVPPPALVPAGPEVRLQAGIATRVTRGLQTDVGGRVVASALLRPWMDRGWRFGIGGELGTEVGVQKAGFKGTWTDWAIVGLASWTYTRGAWELEPHAGGGISRSALEGTDMMVPRSESATLALIRTGLAARRRLGLWSVGAAVVADAVPSTPTYTRSNGMPIFEVPAFAFTFGVFAAADLNR